MQVTRRVMIQFLVLISMFLLGFSETSVQMEAAEVIVVEEVPAEEPGELTVQQGSSAQEGEVLSDGAEIFSVGDEIILEDCGDFSEDLDIILEEIQIIAADTVENDETSDEEPESEQGITAENLEAVKDESVEELETAESSAGVVEETATADELIMEIEVAEDPGYASVETVAGESSTEYAGDAEFCVEEGETILLEETGDASCASWARLRTFSIDSYGSSYGEQLSDESLGVFQAMYEAWSSGGTGSFVYSYGTAHTFLTDGTLTYDDAEKKYTAQWDKASCEEYQNVLIQMRAEVQSGFDAFAYDYPEAFWLGRVAFSYNISFTKYSETQLKGAISSVTIAGKEKYDGASGEMALFQAAVDAAAGEVGASLPAGADACDTVRAIHDYVCKTVSYGENEYAHTAAGVFHKENRTVVCEGYAKAVKILCRRFGIPCALIVGNALLGTGAREAHMWNYVKLEDGNWYLVDATWDDQSSGIRYVYFLAGSSTRGFNAVISEERQTYTCFSSAAYTKSFTLPVLNGEHHHAAGDWTVAEEAACEAPGKRIRCCLSCGAELTDETVDALGHDLTYHAEIAATCTSAGNVEYWSCSHCGKKYKDTSGAEELSEVTVAAHGHSPEIYHAAVAATCTSAGNVEYWSCSRCGKKYKYANGIEELSEVTVAAHGHSPEIYHAAVAATCTSAGNVEYWSCSRCGKKYRDTSGAEELPEVTVAALNHDLIHHEAVAATCTSAGNVEYWSCSRCGKKYKDGSGIEELTEVTVAALGHAYSTSWTTDQAATCTKAGSSSRHCSRCGSQTDVTVITASGHSYGSWTTTRAATVLKAGVRRRTCRTCGAVQKKSIAKLKKTIKLNVTRLPLKVKQSTTAVRVTKMSYGDSIKSWKSSNKKIATVTKTGKITGKKAGTATITVTLASGAKASVKVTVQKTTVKTTKLTVSSAKASLKNNKITLKKGKKISLTAAVTPLTSLQKVTYQSSNKKVATVSKSGTIQAKKRGTTVITVKSGSIKVTCKVTVR